MKITKTIGYKVVSKMGDRLVSVIVAWNSIPHTLIDEFALTYEVGKLVKPKVRGTKLFCFLDEKDAHKFLTWGSYWNAERLLFKAELTNVHLNGWLTDFMTVDDEDFDSLRDFRQWFKKNDNKNSTFPSAATCTSIKLLERIE